MVSEAEPVSTGVPRRQRLAPSLSQIQANWADRKGAIRRAYTIGAYTLTEIGAHFGLHQATISRLARRPARRCPAGVLNWRVNLRHCAHFFLQELCMRNITRSLSLVLALVSASALAGSEDLIGAWEVEAVHWRSGDSSRSIDAAQPGLFLFGSTHYSLMWTPTAQPRTPFQVLAEPTDAEILAGFRSIVFNAGRYVADGDRMTTTALVAKVPGFEGGQQLYRYSLDGDQLRLIMFDEIYPDGSKPAWSGKVETTFVLRRAQPAREPAGSE